jgi:ketosteroid isomerase-like protein
MNKVIPVAFATIAALTASGCTSGAKAHFDSAKVEESIRAGEAQWQKDYAAKDINALAGHYAEDAALGGPGDPLATSESQRRKMLQNLIIDPNMKIEFAADRVQVAEAGDMAYSRGHYTLQMTDKATNKPSISHGSYLTVYKKEADGSWKAVEDFITPGPALGAETAAK